MEKGLKKYYQEAKLIRRLIIIVFVLVVITAMVVMYVDGVNFHVINLGICMLLLIMVGIDISNSIMRVKIWEDLKNEIRKTKRNV